MKKINPKCIKKIKKSQRKGYVVLLTVLIIGAVATTIATSLLFSSVDAARNVTTKSYSKAARALADGCAEEALEQIRESQTFSGFGSLTLGNNTCGYNVTNLGGQNRQIVASSTVSGVVRKVKITIDMIKPTINITSWQEVIGF